MSAQSVESLIAEAENHAAKGGCLTGYDRFCREIIHDLVKALREAHPEAVPAPATKHEDQDLGLLGSEASANAQRPTPRRWEPITTVPKDGSEVVLCVYSDYHERWIFWVDYWRTYLDGINAGWGKAPDWPTHWMQLPLPPDVDGGASGDAHEVTTPANPKEKAVAVETLERLIATLRAMQVEAGSDSYAAGLEAGAKYAADRLEALTRQEPT